MSARDLLILATVANGAETVKSLNEKTGLVGSVVCRRVSDLRQIGLLDQKANPHDRRAPLIAFTKKAHALLTKLTTAARQDDFATAESAQLSSDAPASESNNLAEAA